MEKVERHARMGRKFEAPPLSVNENALAYAMLHGEEDSITQYSTEPDGTRIVKSLRGDDWQGLVQKFEDDPKEAIAVARKNVFSISLDQRLPKEEKAARIERYVNAYLELQIKLDRTVFPEVSVPRQGVPEYIPDGLVDMGSDPTLAPHLRSREMLRVDKREVFRQMRGRFIKYFTSSIGDSSSTVAKVAIIKGVAAAVYNDMPYDHASADPYRNAGRIVGVHEALEDKLAVCRHHALYTQAVLQACGITSRLLKCDVDFGKGQWGTHVANVVRVNNQWYLLDATNPDQQGGVGEVFLAPLPDEDIDTNSNTAKEWIIPRKHKDEKWKYRMRNNMYFMVLPK